MIAVVSLPFCLPIFSLSLFLVLRKASDCMRGRRCLQLLPSTSFTPAMDPLFPFSFR